MEEQSNFMDNLNIEKHEKLLTNLQNYVRI